MRPSSGWFLTCILSFLLIGCGGGGGSGASGGSIPPSGATPAPAPAPVPAVSLPTVNAITLQSDAGDAIGLGQSYRYSAADATISVSAQKNKLVVKVDGDEQWTGVFQTGAEANELKIGEYRGLDLYVDNMDPAKGGLTWWGNGRTCKSSTGWVIIDNVAYSNGRLEAISLRFQRHCDGATAALRGEVKYNVNDKTPPTPIGPAPADLWRPPAGVMPGLGNHAYFESAEGDYLGLGKTYRFDDRSARFYLDGGGSDLAINIVGADVWRAQLRGLTSGARLVPGYYPGVRGVPFNNPVRGGLAWMVAGRGCSQSSSWFAVDAVEYDNLNNITALDLRFEQHCEGREAALRGMVRYRKVPDLPGTGIVSAAGSWRAPAAALPATENFFYVESEPGEAISGGVTELQTSNDASIEVSADGNKLEIFSKGNRQWNLQFQAPARLTQIVPGAYEGLTWSSGDVARHGALLVGAEGNGCFTEKGWIVVDSASYSAGKLTALELRFEHTCGGYGITGGRLHGQLRWRAGVANAFPPPATPPGQFWRPAIALPAGNYVYTMSDRSDFVGVGESLHTPLNSDIAITEKNGKLDIAVRGDASWRGTFETIATAGKVLPGYYAGLGGSLRPARGGFDWSGDGRGCNASSSGVVVDHVAYAGDKLSELRLRFEQHCEHRSGATRGEIQWFASDTRQPPGPRQPIPASLWRSPAGALPDKGNFFHVDSMPGDAIGYGKKYLLTPGNASLSLVTPAYPAASSPSFAMTAKSGTHEAGNFILEFQTMRSIAQLQPGFYDHTLRVGTHNPAFGGLSLHNNGIGCNSSIGWVALDKVNYVGGRLTAIRGRFEHYCESASQPSRGEFNWEE